MIILHVKQTFINRDERDSYYAALCASGVPAASRAEDGNIMYDYFCRPRQRNAAHRKVGKRRSPYASSEHSALQTASKHQSAVHYRK